MKRSIKLFLLLFFVLFISANTNAGLFPSEVFNNDHTIVEFINYMEWITGGGDLGTDFSNVSDMALSGYYKVAAVGYEAA